MTFRNPPRGPSRRTIARRFEIYRQVLPDEIAIILAEFTPVNSSRGSGIVRQMGERVQDVVDSGVPDLEEARDIAYQDVIDAIETGEELPWELASLSSP